MDVRNAVSCYLEENRNNSGNLFIQFIKHSYEEGKLDRNRIRRAILQCFHAQDKNAVFVGSLLLQLKPDEVIEILNEKLAS